MKQFPDYLKDVKRVGLFGLGISNIGAYRFLAKRLDVEFILRADRLTDIPTWLDLEGVHIGEDAFCDIDEDILILSPSVNRKRREIRELGVRKSSDAELFFELVDAPVFSVSGSDGKSTTTELTARLLSFGATVEKCGNCGTSMLDALEGGATAYACELSSFMLDSFIPRSKRAVITCISENHLDFHGSLDAYVAAKENIYRGADECVINADTDYAEEFIRKYKPYALVSAKKSHTELKAYGAQLTVTLGGGAIEKNGEPILPLCEIRRSESHNISNLMSAMALADGYYKREELCDVARSFSGLSHRCESIGVYGGVEYIDSSVDSSPARTATTLSGLCRPVILLLGGRGKGFSYEPLTEPILRYARAVILGGENADEIYGTLMGDRRIRESGIPIYRAQTLGEQIRIARSIAKPHDTVLLSPASASFDQFKNFEDRANYFKSQL